MPSFVKHKPDTPQLGANFFYKQASGKQFAAGGKK